LRPLDRHRKCNALRVRRRSRPVQTLVPARELERFGEAKDLPGCGSVAEDDDP
jgi:hypothetical protein